MSWQVLVDLAGEPSDAVAPSDVGDRLHQAVQAVAPEQRGAVLASLARHLLDKEATAARLFELLAEGDQASRELAIELAVQWPHPLAQTLIPLVWAFLLDTRLRPAARLATVAVLLAAHSGQPAAQRKLIDDLIRGLDKNEAIELLLELERRVGTLPVLIERRERLERKVRMRCPRCAVQLRRPDMIRHLWEAHRLLLIGGKVREPWSMVEEWLMHMTPETQADVWPRCRELALRDDPDEGLLRLEQRLLAYGHADAEADRHVRKVAHQRGAVLCPRCYALVPTPPEQRVHPLIPARGRLADDGYVVEVSENGWWPRLVLETPRGVVYRGPESERLLTRRGAQFFLPAPFVLVAVLGAGLLSPWPQVAVPLVVVLLLAALLTYGAVALIWPLLRSPLERAIDYAWGRLVPRLHDPAFDVRDAAFAARLALGSVQRGQVQRRQRVLNHLAHETEKAALAGGCPIGYLAALSRLMVEDAARSGSDPVMLVVHQLERVLKQQLPMSFAEHFLMEWESTMWTAGNLARLRVLLLERAFAAGLRTADLVTRGRQTRPLGEVLGIENLELLAQLEMLHQLRPAAPWEKYGKALTVFEVAEHADLGTRLLGQYPDLLLAESPPEDATRSVLVICSSGVVFQEQLFREMPPSVVIQKRLDSPPAGYEIVIGTLHFPFPRQPTLLARKLEGWLQFFFKEFQPNVPALPVLDEAPVTASFSLSEELQCPDCQTRFRGKVGTGVLVE
ncbi:MAG: hypothetical protein ACK4RK_11090 [Gemmataceae bacterium]